MRQVSQTRPKICVRSAKKYTCLKKVNHRRLRLTLVTNISYVYTVHNHVVILNAAAQLAKLGCSDSKFCWNFSIESAAAPLFNKSKSCLVDFFFYKTILFNNWMAVRIYYCRTIWLWLCSIWLYYYRTVWLNISMN